MECHPFNLYQGQQILIWTKDKFSTFIDSHIYIRRNFVIKIKLTKIELREIQDNLEKKNLFMLAKGKINLPLFMSVDVFLIMLSEVVFNEWML